MIEWREILTAARSRGRDVIGEFDTKRLMSAAGVSVPRGQLVGDAAAAIAAAKLLSSPLVVKLMSPDAIHKSDIGAVRIGLRSADEVAEAVKDLGRLAETRSLAVDGYLVEEMAPAGAEIAVGGVIDSRFGPVIMVGLGGIFVEIFSDVAFRICPINARDAAGMLDELQGAPLLAGARGREAVSRPALIEALLRIGGEDGLLLKLGADIRSFDMNPLIVSAKGAVAVDGRIELAPTKETVRA